MLFNSLEYLCFFILVLAVSWCLVGFPKLRIWVMLGASYYFYASNNGWLLILILVSTQIDYFAGIAIEKSDSKRARKTWLTLSVFSNLSILAIFKYFNFFAESLSDIAALTGYTFTWVDMNIALPVGISFYTFQSMSYTIDIYRRRMRAEYSWYKFAFFVGYFPQLIAGPIVRAKSFLPQLNSAPLLSRKDFEESIFLIFRGLVKKIVLADFLAVYADQAFGAPDQVHWFAAWIGVYAFTFQIYFDFSGYTDIARGSARLMGYQLPENFNRPYAATSITDFWRRWHLSLSGWLRDYLYVSLGGNRTNTRLGTYRNLMLTMSLGGLWHGAAWNFVLWGIFHGMLLVVERIVGIERAKSVSRLQSPKLVRRIFYFHAVVFSWILFRGESMSQISDLLAKMFSFDGSLAATNGMVVCMGIVIAHWFWQFISDWKRIPLSYDFFPFLPRAILFALIAVIVVIFNSGDPKVFIYFRF